jgi:hypothetical protein
MRYLVIALAALASATVSAQGTHGAAQGSHPSGGAAGPATTIHATQSGPRTTAPSRTHTPRTITPSRTPPRTVAPPIVLPFPSLTTPPTGGLTHGFPFRPSNEMTRPGRHHRGDLRGNLGIGGFVGGYVGEPAADAAAAPPEDEPASGGLRLSVTPASGQVFIDGLYVGTVSDVEAQRVLMLDEGPHRLEIRAPQYESLGVDLRITPYEVVTYRGALDPIRRAPAAPPTAAQTTMYVIPKCYAGNVPPRPGHLPAGCDIKHVQVLGRK